MSIVTHSLNLTPNDTFKKLFHQNFIYPSVFAKNLLRGNREEIFCSYLVLLEMSDLDFDINGVNTRKNVWNKIYLAVT